MHSSLLSMPQLEDIVSSQSDETLPLRIVRCIDNYVENRAQDNDILWRRIPNDPNMVKETPDGKLRLTSAAFRDGNTGEVSVHLAKLTTMEKALFNKADKGMVAIKTSYPRSLNHLVAYDPVKDDPTLEDDLSHTLICPPEQTSSHRKRDARLMAENSHWLRYPESYRTLGLQDTN